MPFERFDGRAQRPGQRMAALRRLRVPLFVAATVFVFFNLFAQSSITRNLADYSGPRTNIGWQSFLPAYNYKGRPSKPSSASAQNASDSNAGNWWEDVEDDSDEYDGFEDPTAEIWDPFIINDRPITEVTAKACIWPPSVYDSCTPDSSAREDTERGKWIRVEKDINMRVGIYYLYLFYRRLPLRSSADTVRDFKLVTISEEPASHPSESQGWKMIPQDMRDGVWPTQEVAHLYYRTAPRSDGNKSDEINEMDVVWGSSGTLFGWDRLDRDFADSKEKSKLKDTDEGAELMWRKGTPQAPKAPLPLRFSTSGNFKIMQIADLHFSVGKGKCLDSNWPGCNDDKGSDLVTLDWLHDMLEDEKPDLVILSGDQLNGQDTSYSAESVILKVAKIFENHKVPWTAVLGNHDSEKTTLTRYGQFVMMQALPYFVGKPGPIEVDGEGNYVLKVHSADESKTPLLTLYFLDSHAYASSWNFFSSEYDWMKDSQIAWYKKESQLIKPIERPFSPPVLEDSTFGNIEDDLGDPFTDGERRRSIGPSRLSYRQDAVSTIAKKPNAMAVFHIPVKEVYDSPADTNSTGGPMLTGWQEDGRGAPKKGDFYVKGLLSQTELGSTNDADGDPDLLNALREAKPEVKVVLNGHCHTTESCKRIKGIWNCFAGGSSYSGYGEIGFDRGIRVYQVSDYGETIATYKIVDSHSDTSGKSAVSHESAGEGSADGRVQDIEAEEKQMEAQLQAAIEAEGEDKRKRATGSERKKIDEMVLVGKGASE